MNAEDLIGIFFGGAFFLLWLGLMVILIIGLWTLFTKAGQPGWAALIPIYNYIVLLQIVGRPWWFLLLMIIPLVNIAIAIIVMLDLAKSFGKGTGFAVGLIFLSGIFILILAFGDARYIGPAGRAGSGPPTY